MAQERVIIDMDKLDRFVKLLLELGVPPERESAGALVEWRGSEADLANAYFAIVAICNQT